MEKFRGKHEGKERGEYTCRSFRSEHENEDDNSSFALGVNEFLGQLGYQVGYDGSSGDDDEIGSTTFCYHIAGASIGVAQEDWNERYLQEDHNMDSINYTDIDLVSNDGLDEMVEKILDKFPSFKEKDFNWR